MSFLPWRNPQRQETTTGWWGWFPNVPRHPVGRFVWFAVVGAVAVAFAAFTVTLLVGLVGGIGSAGPNDGATGGPDGGSSGVAGTDPGASSVVVAILVCVVMLLGFFVFLWHLLHGIALLRHEGRLARELHRERARVAVRLDEARRRLRGDE